jgi:hypothetical protein
MQRILSLSVNQDIGMSEKKVWLTPLFQNGSSFCMFRSPPHVIECFGHVAGYLELNDPNICCLESVTTVDICLHTLFDEHQISFDASVSDESDELVSYVTDGT